MKELDTYLAEYGLEVSIPNRDQLKSWLKETIENHKNDDAFDFFVTIITQGVRIVVQDVDSLFEKFGIGEEYNSLAKIIEKDMIYSIILAPGYETPIMHGFQDSSLVDVLERDIKKHPEEYGISPKEIQLIEVYRNADVATEKAVELMKSYYELLNYLEEQRKVETDRFMNGIKKLLEGKKLDETWLKQKIKRTSYL